MTENLVQYMNVLNFIKIFLVQHDSMKLVIDENKCLHRCDLYVVRGKKKQQKNVLH